MNLLDKIKQQRTWANISILAHFVSQDKTPTFIVGGWVRDLLLDVDSDDIDIVVEGDGIAFAKRFCKFLNDEYNENLSVVVFERFGTAKLTSPNWDLDFVGARKESYTHGSRNPEVSVGTLQDDIERRDLTINAMSISLNADSLGELVDHFNGQQDLKDGVIQTPIHPCDTFEDDPLRMLRAIRFAARFGFRIENETMTGIIKTAHRISIISDERIAVELDKMLKSKNPKLALINLEHTGLMEILLPELLALRGREYQNGISHKDNYLHTLEVVKNTREVTDDIVLLWVAVLHDIGKAKVKKFENNKWQFHNHELVSERMINKISTRFKWSSDRTDEVKKITKFHGVPKELTKDVSDSAMRRFFLQTEDIIDKLFMFCYCDLTTSYEDKKKRQQAGYIKLFEDIHAVIEADNLRNWKNPLKGEWLIKELGMKPGPQMGVLLEATKEAIMEGIIPNEVGAAQAFAESWYLASKMK